MVNIYNEPDSVKLIEEIHGYIDFLEKNLCFKNARIGKINKWIEKLNDNSMSISDKSIYLWQINRYHRILGVIKSHHEYISSETIRKILKGGCDDLKGEHDNYFFEIDILQRVVSGKCFNKRKFSINLKEQTDIVLGNTIFIECKKVGSRKALESNIRDANKQLKKLKPKQFGIVALDISDVMKEHVDKLIDNYKYRLYLDQNRKLTPEELSKLNFELELKMTEEYDDIRLKLKKFDFNFDKRIIGLIFQTENLIPRRKSFISLRSAKYDTYRLTEWLDYLLEPDDLSKQA
ncbi:TPA: hypothetical protein ACFP41_000597 [Neisseria weaveri]